MPQRPLLLCGQVEKPLGGFEDILLYFWGDLVAYQGEETHGHACVPDITYDSVCRRGRWVLEIRGDVDCWNVKVRRRATTHDFSV